MCTFAATEQKPGTPAEAFGQPSWLLPHSWHWRCPSVNETSSKERTALSSGQAGKICRRSAPRLPRDGLQSNHNADHHRHKDHHHDHGHDHDHDDCKSTTPLRLKKATTTTTRPTCHSCRTQPRSCKYSTILAVANLWSR